MSAQVERWKDHFVAYEDALGSFYALQDSTHATLEHSYVLMEHVDRLTNLRKSLFDSKRRLRWLADDGRVSEIERDSATIEIHGAPFTVTRLAANRVARDGAILRLSFRVDSESILRFAKLTGPMRIKFPFGDAWFVAVFRLVGFDVEPDYCLFTFAAEDPI